MVNDLIDFDETILLTYTGKILVLSISKEGFPANPRILPLILNKGETEHFGIFDDSLTGFNYTGKSFSINGVGILQPTNPMNRPHSLRKATWNNNLSDPLSGNDYTGKLFILGKGSITGNIITELSGFNYTTRLITLLKSSAGTPGIPQIPNCFLLRKGCTTLSKQYDETINLNIVGAIDLQFDEIINTIHNPNTYDSTIYLYISTPELISTSITFTQIPVKFFNSKILLFKTYDNTYDNIIHLKISNKYDEIIKLVNGIKFDEKVYLYKYSLVEWDNIINFIHTTSYNFDESIILTNNPQYVQFDNQISLIGIMSSTYNERIILYKEILGNITFDEIINIQSTVKFDEMILLSHEKSVRYWNEIISLKKGKSNTFNETIYLSKSGTYPGGRTITTFNYTISLIKSGFDETILIARKPVCQVGDVVRSGGRAMGIIVGGVEFTI